MSLNLSETEIQEWQIRNHELKIYECIGKGCFGNVNAGEWRRTPVAVKTLLNQDNFDNEEFQKELITLAKLHHPNILQLLGVCTTSAPYRIIFEKLVENLTTYNGLNTSIS